MSSGAIQAERHFKVDDGWLDDKASDKSALVRTSGKTNDHSLLGNFLPRGIKVNRSSDSTEQSAGYAYVRGWLWNETPMDIDDYRINLGVSDPVQFAGISAMGTTARGIKILG